jgi:uncharacterized membrane protein
MRWLKFLFKKFTGFFIKGLLLITPIGLTVYVVYQCYRFIQGIFPTEYFLVSVGIVLFGTAFLGFLGTFLIQTPILQFFDRTLERIPLVKFIYTSIRDLMSAFMGNEKRFSKPVLVQVQKDGGMYKLGFITQKDLTHIGVKSGKSAVYMPHSYNFSGNLFIVDNESITPIDAASEDVMKFIVSGGITKI